MRAIGAVLVFVGLFYAISCIAQGYPWVGAPGILVAVGGAVVLLVVVPRVRREAAELKKFGLRRPPVYPGTGTSRPSTAHTWGRVLAMSKRTSSRPDVSLILAGQDLLWDGQAVSASALQEVEELDHHDQLQWRNFRYRDQIRSLFRSSGITRNRQVSGLFDRAMEDLEAEKFRDAFDTLRKLESYAARAGDLEVARGIIDLAGAIENRVDGELSEECAALIERATKAMETAVDSGTGPTTTTTTTPPAKPNVAMQIAGGVVVLVGIALIIGNVTGAAPTFAYAGFLTTLVGGLLVGAGRGRRI